MRAYISKILFNSGLEIALKKDDIVVFVGPNNVGKSQTLQDLDMLFERPAKNDPYFPLVVKDLNILYEDMNSAVDEAVKHGWAKKTSYGIKFEGNHYNESEVIKQHTSKGFGTFKEAYVYKSSPGDRSGLTGSNYHGEDNDFVRYDPIHFISDYKELRNRASDAFRRVFGNDLIAHRMNIDSMFFCLGSEDILNERTTGKVGNDSLDAYKEYMDGLPKLNDQSDGVVGFASIVVNMALDHKKIYLLDEPETFIHPPQVQILGSTICEFSNDRQVFIATHSQDIIKGLLDNNPSRIKIIRITRETENKNTFKVLDNEKILELWKDPFLKYSDVLSSLFYRNVIVCESDSDCKMYGVLLNDVMLERGKYSQVLLLPAYGKQRIYKVVEALNILGIAVISIFDIDILSDLGDLSRIINASKGNAEIIKADYKLLNQKLQGASSHINRETFRKNVNGIIDQSNSNELGLDEVKEIIKNLEITSKWGYLKKYGYTAIPSGDGMIAYSRIESYINELGIYIVKQGEIENFIKSVSGHGPEWVSKVFEKYPDHNDSVYDEIKGFVRSWNLE